MQLPILYTNKIKYTFENGTTILNNISLSIKIKDRIGLIGNNGSGKSTLLKILSGKLQPTEGEVISESKLYYLSQVDLIQYRSPKSVYEYIEEYIEEWWIVPSLIKQYFYEDLDPQLSLKTLSGGEIMKLNLCIGLAMNPEILLLDEPTNHLDINSLNLLKTLIKNLDKTFLIVSHDSYFLQQVVSSIWDLQDTVINIFTGSFEDYKKQKQFIVEAKDRRFEVAQKELNKTKQAIRSETERVTNSRKVGKEIGKKSDRSTDGFSKKFFKDSTDKSEARNKLVHDTKLEKAKLNMEENKNNYRKKAHLSLVNSINTSQRLVIDVEDSNLMLNSKQILINNINLKIYNKDRIAIMGSNGSGKTSIIHNLKPNYNELPTLSNTPYILANLKTEFIDQKYNIVNPLRTVLENILDYNKNLNLENARRYLGNLLFIKDFEIHKMASFLSGGELARLSFAMITSSNIDLLILDEPTNNLDIETIAIITNALKDFSGTIICISHNIEFLKELNLTVSYLIKNKQFKKMYYLPNNSEDFLNEILNTNK